MKSGSKCLTAQIVGHPRSSGIWLTKDKICEGPAGAGDTADALHLGGRDVGGDHAQRHAMRQRHVHPHKQGTPKHACTQNPTF